MTLTPASSRPPDSEVQVDLTAAQIAALSGTPITLLAQQGASTVIVPVSAAFQYKPGTVAFKDDGDALLISVDETALQGSAAFGDTVAVISNFSSNQSALGANTAMTLSTGDPVEFLGPIATTALNSGGSGYTAGDTGTIDGGSTLAGYTVDTVDGGGAILTYHLTSLGQGYAVATGVATTVLTGGGDAAFTVDILTITNASNGTGRVTVLYYVMALR